MKIEYECQPDPSSVRKARELVTSALAAWDMDDLVDVAELLTSELVTNAVLHAGTAFRVAVEAEPPVARVEVSDGRIDPPVPTVPARDHDHGRGLMLVEALASQWGSRVVDGGKVVWFALTSALAEPGGRSAAL